MAESVDTPIETVEQFRRKSREEMAEEAREKALDEWKPKTALGKKVKEGKVKNIDEVLNL